jgi:hypothetical protein
MNPADITALIHCYVDPEPLSDEAAREIASLGLVVNLAGRWRTTSKGAAHVQQLCNLELPTEKWVGADGKVIDV